MTKHYFPNLNGIRCIASLMVLFHHIEQAKHGVHQPNIYDWAIIQHLGRLGVGLFFVLSGFLITYLLLSEKNRFGDLDTGKFYLRRVFRIWPIYFLIVLLSLFVFPHLSLFDYPGIAEVLDRHTTERITLLMLVLPNYAFVLYELPYWCAQAWSIGVEEQFYYLWPWLIKYPKRKTIIILLFVAASLLFLWIGIQLLDVPIEEKWKIVATFFGQFRIQIMALGGGCAWLFYKQKFYILNVLFRKDLQVVVYSILLILFFSGIHFPAFLEVYSVFFGYFILNVSCNPNSIINLENSVMSFLGKISYGLYLYHVVVVILVINIMRIYLPAVTGPAYHIVLYFVATLGSVVVSTISYNYFEKPLLAFKDKHFGR
ncbi:peptidoglycan/LPS O-acetylase OafA/YrhL [Dyadobacter jejuensis]|uniref:Peptidoglycan/LPS O-acetylase OafA/YrhL n=1 Tax=Dyadobacter jejuensis TaxID=1082580 RepID=A0A316AS89_9BACT|nr:acyltransferase [Dyadobacter jejuensis]PWJ60124.1 peptidoglycan/LPS O-acetylase OafA/YrhL [Dyadobacter jejuensis]